MNKKSDLLEGLNERQRNAVQATEGRIRIVAGAGSGKTKALSRRYAYLVEVLGISPANILCMTFTNKAAQEMKQRISLYVSEGNYNDFVCTIHGFCVKFLRREIYRLGFPRSFSILDAEDQSSLARQILEEYHTQRSRSTVRDFLVGVEFKKSLSSPYEDRLTYIDRYMLPGAGTNSPSDEEKDRLMFADYLHAQVKLFSLDFNDLIHFTIFILKRYEEARKYWQNELNYIMLDEAQDCNENDWMILDLLSRRHNNLFVVGDPDQAIYEWRGAVPELFNSFHSDRDIILDENYRSTPEILRTANSLISHNRYRMEKNLFTKIPSAKKPLHFHAKNEEEEALWIAEKIKKAAGKGIPYTDFAVLYRASYLSRTIEQSFLKNDIPYDVWGGVRFFERKEIKDALAYLGLVARGDDLSFQRIANVPSRKMGKVFMENLQLLSGKEETKLYDTLKNHLDRPDFNRPKVKGFICLIEKGRELKSSKPPSDILGFLLEESGLMDEIRKDGQEERLENIEELMHSLKTYEKEHAEDTVDLDTYLQDIALYTNADYKDDLRRSVKMMTIHQAKGLEFPYVFVYGLSEGIFPSYQALRERAEKGEEEERRLMYVAITRARKALFFTDSEGYSISTMTDKYPSRFLLEMGKNNMIREGKNDTELMEGMKKILVRHPLLQNKAEKSGSTFHEGDSVVHEAFGEGIVLKVNDRRGVCLVRFEGGERNIRYGFLKKRKK